MMTEPNSHPGWSAGCTLAGMRIDSVDEHTLLDHVFASLAGQRGGWLVTANLDIVRRHSKDQAARALYDLADIRVADGMPLVWASRLQGEPLPERVAGSSLIWRLAERAATEGRSLYLLGGSPSANQHAVEVLVERFPGLRVCGHRSPKVASPPDPGQMHEIGVELQRLQPDILLVGLGSPKQEQVIAGLRGLLARTWMVGVGISIGFVAGEVRRAPRWMQRSGLEWLHRMVQDPRRLARRYLLEDLPFALRLFWGALWRRVAVWRAGHA